MLKLIACFVVFSSPAPLQVPNAPPKQRGLGDLCKIMLQKNMCKNDLLRCSFYYTKDFRFTGDQALYVADVTPSHPLLFVFVVQDLASSMQLASSVQLASLLETFAVR